MIDFVKVRNNDKGFAERLRQHPEFEFFGTVNTDTGEEQDGKRMAKVKNLEVVLFPSGFVEITGSLHVYANDGQHNCDAFNYARLVATIGEVATLLDTSPDRLTLHNCEFGVNVLLDTFPSRFMDNVLNYWYNLPEIRYFGGKGYLKQWEQQNYILKVYDKKRQCRLDTNILRIEVKAKKMKHLAGVEVRTLADLLDITKLRRLGVELCKTYEGLIIGEALDIVPMSRPERRIYEQGMNPNFWRDLTDRNQRKYNRKRFEQVLTKYGSGQRKTIGRLIVNSYESVPPIGAKVYHPN